MSCRQTTPAEPPVVPPARRDARTARPAAGGSELVRAGDPEDAAPDDGDLGVRAVIVVLSEQLADHLVERGDPGTDLFERTGPGRRLPDLVEVLSRRRLRREVPVMRAAGEIRDHDGRSENRDRRSTCSCGVRLAGLRDQDGVADAGGRHRNPESPDAGQPVDHGCPPVPFAGEPPG